MGAEFDTIFPDAKRAGLIARSIRSSLAQQVGAEINCFLQGVKDATGVNLVLKDLGGKKTLLFDIDTYNPKPALVPADILPVPTTHPTNERLGRMSFEVETILPLLFGVRSENGFDYYSNHEGIPYDLDPKKHGFVADVNLNKFIFPYLINGVIDCLEVAEELPTQVSAYSHLPSDVSNAVVKIYKTKLTDTDGIVLLSSGDRAQDAKWIMMYPQENLIVENNTKVVGG